LDSSAWMKFFLKLQINQKIKEIIDEHSEPLGINVTTIEIKDIKLPDTMKRVITMQAEAEREKIAKIIAAEGEYLSTAKSGDAADIISKHPIALQLRIMQVLNQIAIEKNSTIIFPAPLMNNMADSLKTENMEAKMPKKKNKSVIIYKLE
jgi:hypothetical protein